MPPIKTSKSVKASYSGSKILQLHGRPPSILGTLQGDHVTAYRLIEEGLYRAMSNLEEKEVAGLHWLDNRESLRKRRGKLYDFISAISALRSEQDAENFLLAIDDLLEEYNKKRHKKSDIRSDTVKAQGDMSLTAENLAVILKEVENRYNSNGELIREFFLESSRLLLTFYNKVPHSAYYPIKGFEATSGEGAQVKDALSELKKHIKECQDLHGKSAALTTKMSNYIVPAILKLIHYPEITDRRVYNKKKKIDDDVILQKHKMDTDNYGTQVSKARTNNKDDLVETLAKHIHIVVSVYPELEEIFDVDDVIEDFVVKFIKRDPFGWPKFNKHTEFEDIKGRVKVKYQEIQNIAANRKYTDYQEYGDLVSSSDEEEITTPTPRKPSSKTEKPEALSIAERIELEELRKFKDIIDEKVELEEEVEEIIKKECPTITGKKGKGAGLFK